MSKNKSKEDTHSLLELFKQEKQENFESLGREIRIDKLMYQNSLNKLGTKLKNSKWLEHRHGNGWNEWCDIECLHCGNILEDAKKIYPFCPNCGSYMMKEVNNG